MNKQCNQFYKIVISFILFIFLSCLAQAQQEHTDSNFNLSFRPHGSYVILSLNLAPEVKSYWRNAGQLGLPTKFDFSASQNLKNAKVFWPIPKMLTENGLTGYIYKNNVDFVIKTEAIDTNKNIELNLLFEFSTCQNLCKIHAINLKTTLKPTYSNDPSPEVQQALAQTPQLNKNFKIKEVLFEGRGGECLLKVILDSQNKLQDLSIFLDLPEEFSFNPLNYTIEANQIIIPVNSFNKAFPTQFYINVVNSQLESAEYSVLNDFKEQHSIFLIILFAIIGGLILNIMPCVLPILALKTLQLVKLSGQELAELRKNLFIQALGIILSFVFIAITASVLQAIGEFVSLGRHFQEPSYLITMVIVLGIIAIALVDEIDFNLNTPQFLNKILASNKISALNFFLTGVLATLIALPCVAPFLTIALGVALTTTIFNTVLIFVSMGIGMAMPYLLLALFPKATNFIPKPGPWMISFKKFLGVLIFLTCLWLIYILSTQLGNNSAITLFLLIILIKFALTDKRIFSTISKFIVTLILIILCYFIPHSLHEENNLHGRLIDDVWHNFKPEEISSLIEKDYIVFVDITASWCPTCKINKFIALDNPSVLNFMKNRGVIGMRADISKNTPKEVARLMQAKKHFGIPLNIIYSKKQPNGTILPTFLLPKTIIKELERNF